MDIAWDDLLQHVQGHSFWLTYLADAGRPESPIGIHVAIFSEPFLSFVLSGKKTIESRFSRNRCSPYGEIGDGDIILLKQVAGPICGVTLAKRAWHYDLAIEPLSRIRDRFGAEIRADNEFWASHADALYATLIALSATTSIAPVRCNKRDRRGWVTIRPRQLAFDFR